MSKILISGFYGFGNLGDEAILETMLDRIRKVEPVTEITVLSNNPDLTAKDYKVSAVSRKSLSAVVGAIYKCDVLVSGGGSLLQDVTSGKSIFYYLFIIMMGRLMGKKVMLYSHGIGPINKSTNRLLTKILLNGVHCITVRESNSKSDLIEMGVKQGLITVTADPVIDMTGANPERGREMLSKMKGFNPNLPIIGFSVRTKDFKDDAHFADLKGLLQELAPRYNLVMLPFYYREDFEIANHMQQQLANIIVIDHKTATHETLDLMSSFEVLVGTRLHSLIFAAVSGIPVIGMSYDPKIDYFLETINQSPALDIGAFNREAILKEIESVLSRRDAICSVIQTCVTRQRHSLDDNDRLLGDLIKRG